jgi:hypothetical protein
MHIHSRDRFADVASYDPVTGALDEHKRAVCEHDGPDHIPEGHYARLAGTLVVFYRLNGSLWLRMGDTVTNLNPSSTEVRWDKQGAVSRLTLFSDGGVIATLQYEPRFSSTPYDFGMEEPGDFDFGLFISNVLADPAWRGRIYEPELTDMDL